jgi:hypothetical protein
MLSFFETLLNPTAQSPHRPVPTLDERRDWMG